MPPIGALQMDGTHEKPAEALDYLTCEGSTNILRGGLVALGSGVRL